MIRNLAIVPINIFFYPIINHSSCRTLCDVNYFILIWSFRISICLFHIFSNSKYCRNTICSRGYYQFSDLFSAAVIRGRLLLKYNFRCKILQIQCFYVRLLLKGGYYLRAATNCVFMVGCYYYNQSIIILIKPMIFHFKES